VTVADLQQHISDLSRLLAAAKAGSIAADLVAIRDGLEPFKRHTLQDFASFLGQAFAYHRDGIVPVGKKPAAPRSKAAKDPEVARRAIERVLGLYNRATDPAVTREAIEEAVQALEPQTKAELDKVAGQMGFSQKFKLKGDVLKALRQRILERKGTYERVTA
jgi:hypothetical protein